MLNHRLIPNPGNKTCHVCQGLIVTPMMVQYKKKNVCNLKRCVPGQKEIRLGKIRTLVISHQRLEIEDD